MKRILLVAFALLFTLGITACQDTNQDNNERETIVVGMEAAYAPFNWTVSENDRYEDAYPLDGTNSYVDGYDVQIAIMIAEALDMNLVIKAVEWDGLIPSLNNTSEIDLIIAGMSPTAERAQSVNFTSAYYSSTHVVVLKADSEYANAQSIDDFDGASMVGQLNTIYDDVINQMSGAIHEDPLTDVPTIITAINNDRYDGTVLELPVALAVIETNPDLTYIEFSEGNGFTVSFEDKDVSIALRQTDTELLGQINSILEDITNQERETIMADAINRQP
ncbi:transporter substrate-binding domain-containing protein [Mycoplasmatota bacterium]|nr:transporter substrate-binding domain-containing protein [Mycoplasmatota bacterium]